MSRHLHNWKPGDRRILFDRSGGNCQRCKTAITWTTFHAAHLRAASHGGPPILENGEAWCIPCNMTNGAIDVRDTRVTPLEWQKEALPIVLDHLTTGRVATVMAAPGAGKTLFAGLVFAAGQHAGLWNRLLVLVPKVTLVKQWHDSLVTGYHIELDIVAGARTSGLELPRMDGICMTYQGLLTARERHRTAVLRTPTLVVLDEVHHLGKSVREETQAAAWAQAVRDVVGDLRTELNVAGVLNLSGTLFRTSPAEQISTVRYVDVVGDRGEPRIEAVANYIIHPERLVRDVRLRAPDLFRVGATVEWIDLTKAEIKESAIADLVDDATTRMALRRLPEEPEWIQKMVAETLVRLEQRHRDSRGKHVKALIVTYRQDLARAFAEEVDHQMAARGMQPLAECVVSDDGADAYRALERFRQQKRVGVLCTVGMAGEGYDCPDIAVVTYATNVLTAQYIRQVVARGQRVTAWERDTLPRPLTAAIIIPEVQDLVEQFKDILAPMIPTIEVPQEGSAAPQSDRPRGPSAPAWNDKDLVGVRDVGVDVVSPVSTTGAFDVDPALEGVLAPALRDADLPESWWPRFAHVIDAVNHQRPFDPPILTAVGTVATTQRPEPSSRPLTVREHQDVYRKRFWHAQKWWAQFPAKNGGQPVSHFVTEIKDQVGIREVDRATPEQMKRASVIAMSRIQEFCDRSGTRLPRWARGEGE